MTQVTKDQDWTIRNVDRETKRSIKVYAAKNGLTIAQVLAEFSKKILNNQIKEG